MTVHKLNKKKLYEHTLKLALEDENYESAAALKAAIEKMTGDEIIEYDDGLGKRKRKKDG